MRVLVFTQFFTPEIGATQTRLHAFASGLAQRGHDVEVVCEVPNHPQGTVRPGYGGRLVDRREVDGFRVSYVWVHASVTKTTLTRLTFYASYMALAAAVGVARPRPDVILASSPPLPVASAAALVAARHRVPWVMDVRDLWPAVAVAVGELGGGRARAAAERLESWLYRDADAITTVTEPFRTAIAAKVHDPEKVHLVPNGTARLYIDAAAREPDRGGLGLPADKFLWTYAGNVGVAQGLETAVDAAARLGPEFELLILGDGPLRPALEERADGLPSVVFRDQVEPREAVRYLRASDALLVSLARHAVLEQFVPSKLYDFCAVGRPVVLAADGEPQRLVAAHGAAVPVPAGDAERLAAALRRLRDEPQTAARTAAAGQRFARDHRREKHVDALVSLLERVAR